jgi:hypothetical protein
VAPEGFNCEVGGEKKSTERAPDFIRFSKTPSNGEIKNNTILDFHLEW